MVKKYDKIYAVILDTEGYKLNPLYIETKSERLQLLVLPSLKAKLKEKAKQEGTSVNDLVHSILEDALAEERE